MLNKNDPLIGAVQEVMKRNHAEREAVKLVNEKFGVTDRKALPHERQGEWDAAYKSVLTEGLHPNQQKLDVHEPDKDELTSDDFRKLRAKKKPMEEDVTSPSSMGIKKPNYASGTPAYANKGPQMVNRTGKGNAETGMGRSENIAHQGNSVVTKTSKKSSSVMPSTMKEAKVNPYAVGMAAVEKSTGDEPPMENKNIMKAHKIAKKIIARKKMNEGFNDRHDLSENASAKKQVVADQLNEAGGVNTSKSKLAPIYTQGIKQTKARLAREPAEPKKSFTQRAAEIGRGVEAGARGVASGLTDVGQTSFGYKSGSDYVLDKIMPGRGEKLAKEFPRTQKVGKGFGDVAGFVAGPEAAVIKGATKVPKLASNIYRGLRSTEKAAGATADVSKAIKTGSSFTPTPKPSQKYANAADELSSGERARFQRTLDAKMAAGGPAKKPVSQAAREPTDVDKFIKKAKETPVTPAAKQPNIPAGNSGTKGTFLSKLSQARRNAGSDPKARKLPALRKTTEPTNFVRPGVPATVGKKTTSLARPGMPDLAAGGRTRIVDLSNKAKLGLGAIAVGGGALALSRGLNNQPEPASAAAKTGPSFEKTGRGGAPSAPTKVAMSARKIEATPRKVSDTEVMNAPQYKQAVKAVGGEAGARKIQSGTDVSGVGKVEKGQTIWSKVKSQLEKQPVKGFEAGANKGGAGR